MKHIFIINPYAGKRGNSTLKSEIAKVMTKVGCDYIVAENEFQGHGAQIARQYAKTQDKVRIYACGGDGTLFEIVNSIYMYENVEVAVIPCGSANDFAKNFVKKATVDNMVNGIARKIDLLKVGDEVAVNCMSAGLDANVAGMISRLKNIPLISGKMAYNIAAVLQCIRKKCYMLGFEIDGKRVEDEKLLFGAVMNGRYYGGGFNPTPDALLDDGYIDFLRVKNVPYYKLPVVASEYKKGTHLNRKDIMNYTRCKSVKFISQDYMNITLDGEMRFVQNPKIDILEKALNMVFPQ